MKQNRWNTCARMRAHRCTRTHTHKEIYYWNWLTQLWKPRSPTICHLQTKEWESQWGNSTWVWRPKNQGSWWCNSQSEAKGMRMRGGCAGAGPGVRKCKNQELQSLSAEEMEVPVQEKNLPCPCLFVPFRTTTDWTLPTTPVGADLSVLKQICSSLPERAS